MTGSGAAAAGESSEIVIAAVALFSIPFSGPETSLLTGANEKVVLQFLLAIPRRVLRNKTNGQIRVLCKCIISRARQRDGASRRV